MDEELYPEASLDDLDAAGAGLLLLCPVRASLVDGEHVELRRVSLDLLAEALRQRLPRDSPVAGG